MKKMRMRGNRNLEIFLRGWFDEFVFVLFFLWWWMWGGGIKNLFLTGFSRKKSDYWNAYGENGGRAVAKRVSLSLIVRILPPTIFKIGSCSFANQLNICQRCAFLTIYEENNNCWTKSFVAKYCIYNVGYPIVRIHVAPSTVFKIQYRKVFFCRSIVHISEVCILLGFLII